MPVLEAKDIAVLRGEQIVFVDVSFTVAPGEAILLTGANGAGKSTLLRLLAGLIPLAEGTVTWDGQPMLTDPVVHAGRLRYLAHADALKPSLSVEENLRFWASRWGGDIARALEAVDLLPLAELPARLLSAGQKRRLALARLALAPAPLWLLDEPSVGLDLASIARFGDLLAAHRARGGMVLAATHVPLPLPGARALRLGRPA